MSEAFWRRKPMHEMTASEWESLCDGCGKCCLHKLEDEDDGEVYYTDVACKYLNLKTARCNDYVNRLVNVPECLNLTPHNVHRMHWLPQTCAYKRLDQGEDLPGWHPLVTKNAAKSLTKMKRKAISVAGQAVSELDVHPEELQERVIYWV